MSKIDHAEFKNERELDVAEFPDFAIRRCICLFRNNRERHFFAVRKQSLVMQFDHYILSGFASRLQAADVRSFDGLLYILQEYEVENGSWNQSVVDL